LPHLQPLHLNLKEVLHHAHEPVTHVYFPRNGMTSELIAMADGSAVEVGMAGNEGMSGVHALFSCEGSTETLIQLAGDGVRMGVQDFREVAAPGSRLYRLMLRYMQAVLLITAQGAACNRLHPMEERCARWLLMTQDRAMTDAFPMTHEFLSYMLGTRRATVTMAAGILQHAGLIRYARGCVTVLDRAGLEGAACECYTVMRTTLDGVVAQ